MSGGRRQIAPGHPLARRQTQHESATEWAVGIEQAEIGDDAFG